MIVKEFRHHGVAVDDLKAAATEFARYGFAVDEVGIDKIDGFEVKWAKLKNAQGVCIEILENWHPHLAFTVHEVDKSKYYSVAPSGHLIQRELLCGTMPIELVQEPETKEDVNG